MRNSREIGSEFWNNQYLIESKNKLNFNERNKGFLCGRTALDYIIHDAKIAIGFTSVLLPSYCCHSMIEPFIKNEIDVRFYPVVVGEEGLNCFLPEAKAEEALYLITFFGLGEIRVYNQQEVKKWKFCILDETHSCFSNNEVLYSKWNIKYSYVSYRKWADIKGLAVAKKIGDDFKASCIKNLHLQYLSKKNEACIRKGKYIEEGEGDKKYFLDLYEETEIMLEKDYEGYTFLDAGLVEYEHLDISGIREKRRENGNYLINKLKEINGIRSIYSSIGEGCPLFIPILVQDNLRNDLRRYLIEEEIYLPIHWPISEYHKLHSKEETELYSQELSIVCDQRYGLLDMQRIIDCIAKFFNDK